MCNFMEQKGVCVCMCVTVNSSRLIERRLYSQRVMFFNEEKSCCKGFKGLDTLSLKCFYMVIAFTQIDVLWGESVTILESIRKLLGKNELLCVC